MKIATQSVPQPLPRAVVADPANDTKPIDRAVLLGLGDLLKQSPSGFLFAQRPGILFPGQANGDAFGSGFMLGAARFRQRMNLAGNDRGIHPLAGMAAGSAQGPAAGVSLASFIPKQPLTAVSLLNSPAGSGLADWIGTSRALGAPLHIRGNAANPQVWNNVVAPYPAFSFAPGGFVSSVGAAARTHVSLIAEAAHVAGTINGLAGGKIADALDELGKAHASFRVISEIVTIAGSAPAVLHAVFEPEPLEKGDVLELILAGGFVVASVLKEATTLFPGHGKTKAIVEGFQAAMKLMVDMRRELAEAT